MIKRYLKKDMYLQKKDKKLLMKLDQNKKINSYNDKEIPKTVDNLRQIIIV